MIKILRCDDWIALYIDGENVLENHSLSASELAEVLAERGVITSFEEEWVSNEQVEKWNFTFPDRI